MPLHILLTDYNPLEVYELVIRPEDDVILAPEAGTDQALHFMLFSRLFFVLGVDIVGDVRAEANLLDHLEDQEMRDPSAVGLMLLLEPEYWQLVDAAVAMFTKICQITSRNTLTDDICRPCSSSGSFHKLKSGGLPVRAPPEDCRRKEGWSFTIYLACLSLTDLPGSITLKKAITTLSFSSEIWQIVYIYKFFKL